MPSFCLQGMTNNLGLGLHLVLLTLHRGWTTSIEQGKSNR